MALIYEITLNGNLVLFFFSWNVLQIEGWGLNVKEVDSLNFQKNFMLSDCFLKIGHEKWSGIRWEPVDGSHGSNSIGDSKGVWLIVNAVVKNATFKTFSDVSYECNHKVVYL